MRAQSFCQRSLSFELKKSDFDKIPRADHKEFRDSLLLEAVEGAISSFGTPSNPLRSFLVKGKRVFGFSKLSHELIGRKLERNLKSLMPRMALGRSQIVSHLQLLLEEGVPYRVYRLDISSFYESFDQGHILAELRALRSFSPRSKALFASLLESYAALGGNGVPRGLALSAAASNFMMQSFDREIQNHPDVFYYARYVDDIVVLTSARERQKDLVVHIEEMLPRGLVLNSKKKEIVQVQDRVSPQNSLVKSFSFEYLGYSFKVLEPVKIKNRPAGSMYRRVELDIAEKKISKIKTRITRALIDFSKNRDWMLLLDRLRFLTQNFSVYNRKVGSKKLAGIFYSYPLISKEASALRQLDGFLRYAVLAKTGRAFSDARKMLSAEQKRVLLSQSFVRGHHERIFAHFSAHRISQIQSCWKF